MIYKYSSMGPWLYNEIQGLMETEEMEMEMETETVMEKVVRGLATDYSVLDQCSHCVQASVESKTQVDHDSILRPMVKTL